MKSLDLFNAVVSVTTLFKFYQAFLDTAEYIFIYTNENQHLVENSEHFVSVCTQSEGTFLHHLLLVLEFCFFFFLFIDIFVAVSCPQRKKKLSRLMRVLICGKSPEAAM